MMVPGVRWLFRSRRARVVSKGNEGDAVAPKKGIPPGYLRERYSSRDLTLRVADVSISFRGQLELVNAVTRSPAAITGDGAFTAKINKHSFVTYLLTS